MKNFINRILDLPKLIRTIWFILWIILIILLVMKFCFGIWYPIISKNKILNDFYTILDNNKNLRYLVDYILYFTSGNIIFLMSSMLKKYTKWYLALIINILIVLCFIIKIYNNYLAFPFEVLFTIVVPIIVLLRNKNYKCKIYAFLFPILIQFILMVFQLNILFVRGLPTSLYEMPMLFQIIMQLDYYIFLIITWIGVSWMGLTSVWFFSKDITVLKAAREKELARKKPNMDTITKIDERIAELEKEGK